MSEHRRKLLADAFSVWLYHRPPWARIYPVNALLWGAFMAGVEFVEKLRKGKA